MPQSWTAQGSTFTIPWAGRLWTLDPTATRPGLSPADGSDPMRLLCLAGLARPGLWDAEALSGASLASVESLQGRILATYSPPGWFETTVRAAWSPVGDEALHLEVQISTLSVGQLRRVEVLVASDPGHADPSQILLETRDPRALELNDDGREPAEPGRRLAPAGPLGPALWPKADDRAYAEFVHPEDVTRRLTGPGGSIRSGLFGYDLEKGVVLRGRVRGVWLPAAGAAQAARERFEAFVAEPPPLLT